MKNHWTQEIVQLLEENNIELLFYMEARGLILQDYLEEVEAAGAAGNDCINGNFGYRVGYITPIKVRESLSTVARWLYKDYYQEEAAPGNYHTVKTCTTVGCINPHHYMEVPDTWTRKSVRDFLTTPIGQVWYVEYRKAGTWDKAWTRFWNTPPQYLATFLRYIYPSIVEDTRLVAMCRELWTNDVPYQKWISRVSTRLRVTSQATVLADANADSQTIAMVISTLTPEQRSRLLQELQQQQQQQSREVVAPFES